MTAPRRSPGAEEERLLRRRMDDEDADRQTDTQRVPGHPTTDLGTLAVARRLVVLGGPEALGVEPEHDQQQRQPDGDETT